MRALSFYIALAAFFPLITAAQADVPVFDPAYEGGPHAPVIRSADLPDENAWYRSRNATFSWALPPGTAAVAAELSLNVTEPQEAFRPPITELAIPASDWREGTQYLLVQFRNAEKWGMYAARKVMIDDTPPAPFIVRTIPYHGERSGAIIAFDTTDALSGISHFTVSVNGLASAKVAPDEGKRGYFVPIGGFEPMAVVVQAVDRAGNTRESGTTIVPVTPPAKDITADPLGYVASEPAPLLLSLVTGILLMMFGYLIYERQRYAHALTTLRQETDEIETQMFRVFSALREEISDQIDAINKKTRLTKKEKEAVDGLNKALSVSEQLLNKEVKDVKKLLN